MAYQLTAFVCKREDAECLHNKYSSAVIIDLPQGLSLIPMTENLFDQINQFTDSVSINHFTYLTENIELQILAAIQQKQCAYI